MRGGERESERLTQPGEDVLHSGGEDGGGGAAQDVAAVSENLQAAQTGQTVGQLSQEVVVQQDDLEVRRK